MELRLEQRIRHDNPHPRTRRAKRCAGLPRSARKKGRLATRKHSSRFSGLRGRDLRVGVEVQHRTPPRQAPGPATLQPSGAVAVGGDGRGTRWARRGFGRRHADIRAGGCGVPPRARRLAIEESVGPGRKLGLHRRALAALCGRSGGVADLARAAHHAEAAGDVEAVLRFAPAAAAEAASMGAHREAAAQSGGLCFGDGLALVRRAELWELRSRECYLTDQSDEAIEAIEQALSLRRMLGDKLAEGNALRWLSQILWCPGRTGEAERAALHAVGDTRGWSAGARTGDGLRQPGGDLLASARIEESIAWASRALESAERLGDTETAVHALSTIGLGESGETGTTRLLQALKRAEQAGLPEQAGSAFTGLALTAVGSHRQAAASRYIAAGIDYCSDNGQELYRLYLLAYRSRLELNQGRWSDAAPTRPRRSSHSPHVDHPAHNCLGCARPRAGQTGRSRTSSGPRGGVGPRRADRGATTAGAGRRSKGRGGLA